MIARPRVHRRSLPSPRRGRRWLAAALCLCFLAAGCTDSIEVNNLYVVTGLAFDTAPGGMTRVTADIVNPESSQSQGSGTSAGGRGRPDVVRSAVGRSVEEAIASFEYTLPHRLYMAHNAVVVFSQDYLRAGFDQTMDYLERNRSLRRTELLVVTRGEAADLFRTPPGTGQPAAIVLRNVMEIAAAKSAMMDSQQYRVMRQLLSPSSTALVTWLEPGEDGLPAVRGVTLVTRDRAAAEVGIDDAAGLLWLLGDTHQMLQTIPCPGQKGNLAVRWLRTMTQVRWQGTASAPRFRVVWRGVGEIERWCPGERLDPTTYRQVEQQAARAVRTQIMDTAAMLKNLGLDGAQLGTVLYRADPKTWHVLSKDKEWLRRAQIDVDVHALIKRSNLATQSPLEGPNKTAGSQ